MSIVNLARDGTVYLLNAGGLQVRAGHRTRCAGTFFWGDVLELSSGTFFPMAVPSFFSLTVKIWKSSGTLNNNHPGITNVVRCLGIAANTIDF